MESKTVFLDLDGTVLDVFDRLYRLHVDVLQSMDISSATTKQEYVGLKREDTPEVEIAGYPLKDAAARTIFQTRRIARIEDEEYLRLDRLFSWSLAGLEALRKRHPVILVTARKRSAELREQLRWLQIADRFEGVLQVGRGDRKQSVIERYPSFSCEADVIIGDTEADVAAGHHLGIATVAVTSGLRSESRLQAVEPDYIVPNLMEAALLFG